MKARVKATGEIVEVVPYGDDMYIEKIGRMSGRCFPTQELDYDIEDTLDYWEKLKHQYAGMAMRGILSNERSWEENADKVAEVAICYAKELIKGLKLERSN